METHHIQKADYSKQQSMLSRKLRQVWSNLFIYSSPSANLYNGKIADGKNVYFSS